MSTPLPPLPTDLRARLEIVGRACYGRGWHEPLCKSLGVTRVLLARWRSGSPTPPADLDRRLGYALPERLRNLAAWRDHVAGELDLCQQADDIGIFGTPEDI